MLVKTELNKIQNIFPSQRQSPSLQFLKNLQILQMPIEELSIWILEQAQSRCDLELEKLEGDTNSSLFLDTEKKSGILYEDFESSFIKKPSTQEYLLDQIQQTFLEEDERKIALCIVQSLDSKGFLSQEDAARLKEEFRELFPSVLKRFQKLDPVGIATHSLQQNLQVQLEEKNKKETLAYLVISHHYDLLLKKEFQKIAKLLKVETAYLISHLKEVGKSLRFSPPLPEEDVINPYLKPDLSIHHQDGIWIVEINKPPFGLRNSSSPREGRSYVDTSSNQQTLFFLKSSLEKRERTLRKLAEALLYFQALFLIGESSIPSCMTLQNVAQKTGFHPSTITRAISGKILDCVHGLIPLKDLFSYPSFFSKGETFSQVQILEEMKRILKKESKQLPLNDLQISDELKKRGILCSRRTITKYRKLLNIPSSARRKPIL